MKLDQDVLHVHIDGSCAPKNPGGTLVWGCLFIRNGVPVDVLGGLAAAEASGKATNNFAEYMAFINALREANRRGWTQDDTTVFTDSELLHGQLASGWKVSSPNLQKLHKKATALKLMFPAIRIERIGRDKNKVAHRVARAAFFEARFPRTKR